MKRKEEISGQSIQYIDKSGFRKSDKSQKHNKYSKHPEIKTLILFQTAYIV